MYVCMYMHTCMHAYIIHTQSHACMYVFILQCMCVMVIWLFWYFIFLFILHVIQAYIPWAIKTCHFSLDHNSHVSWWIFSTSCTNGNRYGYSIEKLQNVQLYPNCVSTLPDKKYIKQHILKSFVTIFYYSTARMSPWAKGAQLYCTSCVQNVRLFHWHAVGVATDQ